MKNRIPHSRPFATDSDVRCVTDALRAGRFSQGQEVAGLEQALAAAFGRKEAVAVSSGTAAVALALVALGVRAGDAVALPSYTCQNVLAAVRYADARPLCADVGKDGVCLSARTVSVLAEQRPRAVVAPHMFGYRAEIEEIMALGLPVIEDCAQAVGGLAADGTRLGAKGAMATLSFFATKLLPAGEGGACLTDDADLAATVRALRDSDKQPLRDKAFNFKMSDIAAALARAKLDALADNVATRERIAARYDKAFGPQSFRVARAAPQPVCFRYLLDAGEHLELALRRCEEAGIACRKPVWNPLHRIAGGTCPETDRRHESLLSVPIYPGLEPDEAERICHELSEILDGAN